ncbi:MAG: hypothetical protein HYY22_01545 [Thaumarchaeota archaeon]|nr:hypothetical protein [Nitrososphaerota archaeon]
MISHWIRKDKRRGSSIVIGNLLMLSASVMMATVVLYWALSFQGGAQSSYSTAIFQSNAQASEGISIDDVKFNANGTLTVYARNFADIPMKVAQVYVDGKVGNASETIVVARSAEPILARTSGWVNEATYIIRIATERGNIYERSFQAP